MSDRDDSSKRDWEQFKQAADVVVWFILGDQFLSFALEYDKQLLQDSRAERAILATSLPMNDP
ncbi:MAG TPA: hypothetical protein ENK78_08870 [Thiothrix sp.]|nr:hypothetical protein [Thiothrix sp.]